MAQINLRLPENVPGDFFVDSTCIDCDLCRQVAPETFKEAGDYSVVYRQPRTSEEEFAALKALVTCPTASIGALGNYPVKAAAAAYPELINEGVYFCGFASKSSYGGSSYLIVRPAGNVLVDSPRFSRPLARRISELGGISLIFLTHKDDLADQELWAREFKAVRAMHRDDISRSLAGIEMVLEGCEPTKLSDDLLAIPTPGHTRGHTVLLHRNRCLFSGDHLWWSVDGSLNASSTYCWYSWTKQIASMERLLEYDFEWVLPGHGRRGRADRSEMRRQLQDCIARMKTRLRRTG